MTASRTRWLLPVMSAVTAAAMFAGPIGALADEDHGGGHDRDRGRGDDDDRARIVVVAPQQGQPVVVQRRDQDDEDEDEAPVVAVPAAAPLVNAINNEVAALMNRDVDEDEDEDEVEEVEVGKIVTISLATLETGLSAADATAVTNAVNANSTALHNFLNSGTVRANGIDAALMAAGITPASVQAILVGRDDRLIVVTG